MADISGIPAQDTYTHPTTDGNKHVPATGTTNSGKIKAGATAGSLAWEDDNDTITTINGKTGAISKADIVAIGIPAQDNLYYLQLEKMAWYQRLLQATLQII